MRIKIKIYSKEGFPGGNVMEKGYWAQQYNIRIQSLPSFLKQKKPDKWRIVLFPFWRTFFRMLGTQNVYEGIDKPHWWKTRIGFKTAWQISKIIHK